MVHGGQLRRALSNWSETLPKRWTLVLPSGTSLLRVKTAIDYFEGVLVSIEDSGTGVNPEDLDRIFEAFFTTKSGRYGNGASDLSVDH